MLKCFLLSSFGNITSYFAESDSTKGQFVKTTFKLTGKPSKTDFLPQKEAELFGVFVYLFVWFFYSFFKMVLVHHDWLLQVQYSRSEITKWHVYSSGCSEESTCSSSIDSKMTFIAHQLRQDYLTWIVSFKLLKGTMKLKHTNKAKELT